MKIIKFLFLFVVLVVIAYVGITIYANLSHSELPEISVPKLSDASYSIYIQNTGELFYTNSLEQHGDTPGSRLYVLSDGYWQLAGKKFVYNSSSMILDEHIFGVITFKRRQ